MYIPSDKHAPEHSELLYLYALESLPSEEVQTIETHISGCQTCQRELEKLRSVIDSFVGWPTDVLRPRRSLWKALSERVGIEADDKADLAYPWEEPQWEEVAPGISCKLLSTDSVTGRVSMLVRLKPGGNYPAHRHADMEELHLLDGELMIDDRKLHPGDYYCAKSGSSDARVWSETGCTCVLMTSIHDELQ